VLTGCRCGGVGGEQECIGDLRPADGQAFQRLIDMSCELQLADSRGGVRASLNKGGFYSAALLDVCRSEAL